MTERLPSAASLTRRAIERIEEGDTGDARQVLAEALELDPLYEPAWLWFAHIAESDGERRFCLEQAAAANPESKAKEELPKLRRVEAVEPPELADVVAPPPPPGFGAPSAPAPRAIPIRPSRKAHWIGLAALGLVLALAAVLLGLYNRREAPLYVAVAGGMSGTCGGIRHRMSQKCTASFRPAERGGRHRRPARGNTSSTMTRMTRHWRKT